MTAFGPYAPGGDLHPDTIRDDYNAETLVRLHAAMLAARVEYLDTLERAARWIQTTLPQQPERVAHHLAQLDMHTLADLHRWMAEDDA